MSRLLEKSKHGASVKNFEEILRKAMSDIFNPKLKHTFLQSQVLEWMNGDLIQGRLPIQIRRDAFSMLYSTEAGFRNDVDSILLHSKKILQRDFGEENAATYMEPVSKSVMDGRSHYLGCIDRYAATIDDQQYYQLLYAYKEFNEPLNKEIYKSLCQSAPKDEDVEKVLESIKRLSPYLKHRSCNALVREHVKDVFENLNQYPTFLEAKSDFCAAYQPVFTDNMRPGMSEQYRKRLKNNLENVLRLMRPHYAVIQYAKNLNRMQYRQIIFDKGTCKDLKKSIREHLGQCHTDNNSFSAAFIRQKLEQLRADPSPQICGEIVTYLQQTSPQFRAEMDNHVGEVYERLKKKMGVQKASAFTLKYKEELLGGGEYNSIHNCIGWYAKQLDENIYQAVLRENKAVFKEINSTVVKGLWENIEHDAVLGTLQALKDISMEENTPQNSRRRQELVKSLREFIYSRETGGSGWTLLDEQTEHCVESLRESFTRFADPNAALGFEERLRSDLWQSDLSCSGSFITTRFAEELDTKRLEAFCKRQLKEPGVSEFRGQLYLALQRTYRKGGEGKTQLRAALNRMDAEGTSPEDIDRILCLLSTPKYDIMSLKDKLFESLGERLAGSGLDLSLKDEEIREVFSDFFYGGEHNTFFIRETLQRVADEGIPVESNIFLARRLLLDIGRALCGQNDNARRYAGHGNSEHSFRSVKQFKNVKFPRAQQEEQHY